MQRNKYNSIFSAFIFFLVFGFAHQVKASHFMGGNITYTSLGGNQYAINLSLFRDCNGISIGNSVSLDVNSVSCGSLPNVPMTLLGVPIVRTPLCPNEIDACGSGPGGTYGVEEWIYRGLLTLPAGCTNANDIVLSWDGCCRNSVVSNASPGTIYLYANLDNTVPGKNSSPAFNNEPTLFLCSNQENRYNGGMTDGENDSLVYSLVDCRTGPVVADTTVNIVTYTGSFEGYKPIAGDIRINSKTGEVIATPSSSQVAIICILIEEYRNGVKIGEVIRDLQFTVTDCGSNTLPIISGINGTANASGTTGTYSTTACAGKEICFDIQGFDPNALPSVAFAQNFTLNWNFGINGTFIVDYSGASPIGQFCWTPTAADVGDNFFFVEANDDACPFLGSNVYTYEIEVYNEVAIDVSSSIAMDSIVEDGDTIQLMANVNDSTATISWFPATGLSCTDCLNPTFVVIGTNSGTNITYTATLTNSQGCAESDDVTIDIRGTSTQRIEELRGWNIYPNPVTNQSLVEYSLTKESDVQLELINVIGQKVATIRNENQGSGDYQFSLGEHLTGKSKGMYFLRMTVNGKTATKKLMYR